MPDATVAEPLSFAVEIPFFDGDTTEYIACEPAEAVREVVDEKVKDGEQLYRVNTWEGELKWLPWDIVIGMDLGNEALSQFERQTARARRARRGGHTDNDEDAYGANSDDEQMNQQPDDKQDDSDEEDKSDDSDDSDDADSDDDEEEEDQIQMMRRSTRSATIATTSTRGRGRGGRGRQRALQNRTRQATLQEMVRQRAASTRSSTRASSMDSAMASRPLRSMRASARTAGQLISQSVAAFNPEPDQDYDSESSDDLIISDLVMNKSSRWQKQARDLRQSSRQARQVANEPVQRGRGRPRKRARSSSEESEEDDYGKRRSGRISHARGSMRERDEDDIEVQEVKNTAPRVIYQQEIFREFARNEEFAKVHIHWCDSCTDPAGRHKGPLVFCQGCSTSLHKACIGNRASRDHLVTKLSEQEFVLQCKRCIRRGQKAEKRPPRLDVCTDCRQVGRSCEPFRKFPTTKADREQTPEIDVPGHQVNNALNVLFRCTKCRRAYHFHHLPSREAPGVSQDTAGVAQDRLAQYRGDWQCIECVDLGDTKISDLVAWRPSDETLQQTKDTFEMDISQFDQDELEYLVRRSGDDYSKALWYPGAWVYGVSFGQMRTAFEKHNPTPKWTTTDAIPESYLRIDIVFDVKYTSIVPNMSESVERQRIREVKSAFVKFKGLGYDEAMWIEPPTEEEEGRYADFKTAYLEHCKGNHIRLPRSISKTLENLRRKDFTELEIGAQPKYISGGTLKDYQMDGMNWLYNRWYEGKNAILADEMGLGKTIQIISFLEILHQEHRVWPFLIVAPHSTVPNWMRELRTWAPSLRVVAFFGSSEALRLTRKYELFNNAPNASARDLKCHVVVTSYQAIADHSSSLKPVPWQALIVDEGQRLKSDDTILYRELWTFKFSHKVLLTGTPLQNNIRELFNLLQFLDPKSINAEELEEQYAEVNKDNLHELHDMIRPYFLRRTKAQALKDLPPLSDIIVPLTLSKLQQKLYSSVLKKDAELIRAILAKTGPGAKTTNRSKLNNILIQLRKVLCHPFVYDQEIEEKFEDQELVFRNLVDASSKLKFLEILLPRLHETGHRVLMFSQFLHMLDIMEDFMSSLGLKTLRLDGSNDTDEKQMLIDAYNAPDSPYFSFLLSTRAGGVGINLATADTVIILDPDYNPHQDLQAVARAHRIGQKNKLLVFHLITIKSVEERIIQLSKKKLSLDHLIIQRMGADGQEEEEDVDVENILRHGAEEIIKDTVDEIKYDLESIDKLLDRSQIKETLGEQEQENDRDAQFSFARVWATEKGSLTQVPEGQEETGTPAESVPDLELWDKILQERIEQAAREAAERQVEYGRGRRRTTQATYTFDEEDETTPIKARVRNLILDDDDTDFHESGGESGRESDTNSGADAEVLFDPTKELSTESGEGHSRSLILSGTDVNEVHFPAHLNLTHFAPSANAHPQPIPIGHNGSFNSIAIPTAAPLALPHPHPLPAYGTPIGVGSSSSSTIYNGTPPFAPPFAPPLAPSFTPPFELAPPPPRGVLVNCWLCRGQHMPGECPLREVVPERCGLCGIAHFGEGATCPHLSSITQINLMLDAIKDSNDAPELKAAAKNILRARRTALIQQRKLKQAKAERSAAEAMAAKEAAAKQNMAEQEEQRKGT
ncbi:hypothetical protein DRE_06980 [Drechslerella stenobrocha 248]|uniref:Chromatin remodeling factor mit1 n=1 Tax=Drechslerella stenobrocha 248 TaxID=1043628 RepID=W7I5Y8_9PEZI|nr:hypothetical protein DRE_06980 [Drechslerella stenobrocha 248]